MKRSVAELIFHKVPCYQHNFQNTFRQMRLKNENYTYLTLDIRFLAKIFDGIPLTLKAASRTQVTENKNDCFQLFLYQTYTLTLILRARYFAYPIGRLEVEVNLSSRDFSFHDSSNFQARNFNIDLTEKYFKLNKLLESDP